MSGYSGPLGADWASCCRGCQIQIFDAIGFSETWWNAKKAEYSELGESYKKGSASGLADVANALYENAMNGVLQKGKNSLGKSLLNKTEDCLLR